MASASRNVESIVVRFPFAQIYQTFEVTAGAMRCTGDVTGSSPTEVGLNLSFLCLIILG